MFFFCSHESRPRKRIGQLNRLGFLEQLRAESGALWHATSDFLFRVDAMMRQLENPNLHEIHNMCYRIDLWDRYALHSRWLVAASGNVYVAQAAYDEALKHWPGEKLTLRNGMLLMSENPPRNR
jgi:hypothetical protein